MNKRLVEMERTLERIGQDIKSNREDRLDYMDILGRCLHKYGISFCDPLDPEHGG